jgi:hypothetical protein
MEAWGGDGAVADAGGSGGHRPWQVRAAAGGGTLGRGRSGKKEHPSFYFIRTL